MSEKCAYCGSEDGTLLKEFDNETSYSWGELALMTSVCVSCGEDWVDCPESSEEAWEAFGDIPLVEDGDEIDANFLHFPKGTDRFEIWHWLEEYCDIILGDSIKNKNSYDFTGTYRKTVACGINNDFTAYQQKSETAKEAMNTIRLEFYEDGYDNILFKTCKENGKEITMLEALGLE